MNRLLRLSPIVILLLVAACGTVATPVWSDEAQGTQAALAVTSEYETSIAPTATNTSLPTNTPTPEPTNTNVPTATPTTELATATNAPTEPPTQAPTEAAEETTISGDAANGEILFNEFQSQASFACATCHNVASEDRLIGPGLLNISTHAETRVEGESAYDYIHTSIVNPGAFVVPDYPDGLMPQIYGDIFTEEQIQDIIAYLYTLTG
jgi:mono/diheme cytochrome c family protein